MIVAETTAQPLTPTAGRGQATGQWDAAARKHPPAEQAHLPAACPLLRETGSSPRGPGWRAQTLASVPEFSLSSSPSLQGTAAFLPSSRLGRTGEHPGQLPDVQDSTGPGRVIGVLFPKERCGFHHVTENFHNRETSLETNQVSTQAGVAAL